MINLALCWLLLLGSVPVAFAQKRKTPELSPAPPPVISREVSVLDGESVTIPLGVHGRRTEQLQFLVRTRPKSGKLSVVTATGANSAAIIYTPSSDTGVMEDRFTYAVRSKEGVSAPGIVTIKLMSKPKLPGRLEVPDTLTFPGTLVGKKSEMSFEISNPGGGMVSGSISVSSPWTVAGNPDYRLGPKARATYKLTFQPDRSGPIAGEVLLGPQPRRVIPLTGEGVSPFVVKPARLKMPTAEKGRTRSAPFEIENVSDEMQTVTVTTEPRLLTEKTVQIAAGAKVQVPIFAEPGDGSAFQDTVRLSAGDWTHEIPVEVEPLMQRLKLVADPSSELRGVVGQPADFTVFVENDGGRTAAVLLTVNAPFTVSESRVALGAGEKKRVAITGKVFEEGEHPVEVTAETETAVERLKLTYQAAPEPRRSTATNRVPATSTALARSPVAAQPPAAVVARAAAADDDALPITPQTSLRMEELSNAFGKLARATGHDRAIIEWPASLGDGPDLAVEERTFTLAPGHQLIASWTRLANVTFQSEGETRRALLTRLTPAKTYTVRLRGIGRTFFTVQFTTETKPRLLPISAQGAAAGALFIVLTAFLWWRWKHRSRTAW